MSGYKRIQNVCDLGEKIHGRIENTLHQNKGKRHNVQQRKLTHDN